MRISARNQQQASEQVVGPPVLNLPQVDDLSSTVSVLLNPFKLFGRLMIAAGTIIGYTIILCVQLPWLLWYQLSDEMLELFAIYPCRVIDAVVAIVEERK